MDPDSPLVKLDEAGYGGTLATNSELQFDRYLKVGEQLYSTTCLDSISELKGTALGAGYFVTWTNGYLDEQGNEVGRQIFRVFKFKFGAEGPAKKGPKAPKPEPVEPIPMPDREGMRVAIVGSGPAGFFLRVDGPALPLVHQ